VIGVVFAAAPLFLAATGLVVLGERNGCPSPNAVSARLSQLLPDEAGGAPDALVVDGEPGALRVRLLSAQGSLREQKTLDLTGSCDELADAVATVAVAWRSRLQQDDVPPPVLSARARPVEAAAPAPRAQSRPDLELTLGVQTISGSERWVPGLVLGIQAPIGHGFSFAFALNVPAPRSAQDQTLKTWRWMELGAVMGPSYRGLTENLLVDASVGLGMGVNVTTSESLAAPDSYALAPPAVVAGMRWTYRHSSALPWLGLTFSARLAAPSDSPIENAQITSDAWLLALALGGTFTFDIR